MYASKITGTFNCDAYTNSYSSYLTDMDTTWINVGSVCNDPGDRCLVNSYCDILSSTCKAFPGVGSSCAQSVNMITNGQAFSECAYGLNCHMYYDGSYNATTMSSAVGTCQAMVESGATCSFAAALSASPVLITQVGCDFNNGLECDFSSTYVSGPYDLSGTCKTVGSYAVAGTNAYGDYFCAFPLVWQASATSGDVGQCVDISSRTACATVGECLHGTLFDSSEDGNSDNAGGGNSASGNFGWNYGDYISATVSCNIPNGATVGTCKYNGASCTNQYSTALANINAANVDTLVCDFEQCVIGSSTVSGFTLCTGSPTNPPHATHSQSQPGGGSSALSPSSLVMSLLLLVIMTFVFNY